MWLQPRAAAEGRAVGAMVQLVQWCNNGAIGALVHWCKFDTLVPRQAPEQTPRG